METRKNADTGCACGACAVANHGHEHVGEPARASRPSDDPGALGNWLSLGAACAAAVLAAVLELKAPGEGPAALLPGFLFLMSYLAAGWNVAAGAVRNVLAGRPFDELFLMTISTLGAFAIGHPEEAVGVMVFYRVGEMFQEAAALKSRRSIRSVLALRPDTARVVRGGVTEAVRPESVEVGELVRVLPGERVPLDGILESGEGWLDASALTGESVPRRAVPGSEVLAGAIAQEGVLTVRVSRPASGSYAARIVDLVENASHAKARTERFITRFARWYTPVVVGVAAAVAVLPPLLVPGQEFSAWAYRALVMLVISCPCALVISVPLGYFAGLGGAARRGILVKGSQAFDVLADARTVVFDKTGTLTAGDFDVRSVQPAEGRTETEILALAAAAEEGSNHPIAAAMRKAAGRMFEADGTSAGIPRAGGGPEVSFRELPGRGVVLERAGARIAAGTAAFLSSEGVRIPGYRAEGSDSAGDTEVHVAENGVWAGLVRLGDALKPDAGEGLARLRGMGVKRFVLLTGDAEGPARAAAGRLGISEVHHGLLPHQKLERLEEILDHGAKGRTLFVGDGINDAPVLARADAGVAMGAGADAALENADAVLMTGELSRLAEAVTRARRTRNIVRQNIVLALGFKLAFLALGSAGLANMWEAVVADVGVALLAVLNSSRALK